MVSRNSFFGPLDPAPDAGHVAAPPRVGFFTDTSVCIGCKACEVACKEWNGVPQDGLNLLGMSFDNTGGLGADSWRHVAFIEQPVQLGGQSRSFEGQPTGASGSAESAAVAESGVRATLNTAMGTDTGRTDVVGQRERSPEFLGMPGTDLPGRATGAEDRSEFRWLMASDVCKHCTHAGCLDVCPTGALFRTEFGTVVVQEDICNGCGYCIPACPYGVIDQRKDDGRAWKCTMCYDRLKADLTPACAKACPTDSIQFGPLEELRERAKERVETLHARGVTEARLYGADPHDGVGGDGAFFLLLDEPEVYGLPPDPVVPTRYAGTMWRHAGAAAAAMIAGCVVAFAGRRRS